ncbi:DUF6272 family protein [Trichocoleus sp. DQ-A2]|nr:DUF6272 family protein [Coleofasciculus sp. FACHB-T130]
MTNYQLPITNYQIDMIQIFGDFRDELPSSQEGLTIVFSPTSIPLKQRWRNNGLSADFMADYFATFFPGNKNTTETDPKAEIKSAVSFIANELLENAMKFNDDISVQPISIRLQMHNDRLVFLGTNNINPSAIAKFQAFITELTTCDPSEFYLRQLEKNAEDESESESGLGFLTMMNDYQAKLGWKFETIQKESEPEAIAVTTMVQLAV